LTGKNLEGSKGTGARAARYLVATGLMRRTDSLDDAAAILHDTKAVVDHHYIIDDGQRLAEKIDELMDYP
jgi:hypothetical protein